MKYIEDITAQEPKDNKVVCGDTFICDRSFDSTEFVLCDGIGSGVYANISAISCASRLIELFRSGISMRSACEMVAESMHRARSENIPFSAFTAVRILNNGQFIIYTYEAPNPILIKSGKAFALETRSYSVGHENIGESAGILRSCDDLVICSDGITQAGMGNGYIFGIGSEGVADFINRTLPKNWDLYALPSQIISLSKSLTDGICVDDSTVAVLKCREASEITVMSGPPSAKNKDRILAEKFAASSGKHVICGSTTAEIYAREQNLKVNMVKADLSLSYPPEYEIAGVDMVTEGAATLNQLYNILDENPDTFVDDTPVERLCSLLLEADIVTLLIGKAINGAHTELVFKQLGIRPRYTMIKMISKKLKDMGKLVVEEYF